VDLFAWRWDEEARRVDLFAWRWNEDKESVVEFLVERDLEDLYAQEWIPPVLGNDTQDDSALRIDVEDVPIGAQPDLVQRP
jgi:hypothetical protein